MRIENAPYFVELHITEVIPAGLPSAGDFRLEVEASLSGISGFGSCWVNAREVKTFCQAAKQLVSSSPGSARLESISPGEFSLSLSRANSRGYVRVQVQISKRLPAPSGISGAFEVEWPAIVALTSWLEEPRANP